MNTDEKQEQVLATDLRMGADEKAKALTRMGVDEKREQFFYHGFARIKADEKRKLLTRMNADQRG